MDSRFVTAGNPTPSRPASGAAPTVAGVLRVPRFEAVAKRDLPIALDVPTMDIVMAHSRKGGRRPRPEPTPVCSPLGRWGAMFRFRGNPVMKLEPLGPVVEARTPEELARVTALAMGREGDPDEVN